MKGSTLYTTTGWSSDDYRNWHADTPVHLRCHINDLVKATGDEVNKLHLSDRTHTHQGGTDGRTNNCRFRHRSIDHTLRAKFLQQACTYTESPPISPHVLTQEKNGFISTHLFANGLADGLQVGDFSFAHKSPTASSA